MNKSRNSLFKRPYKYYDILGLSRKATQEEIKKAYRELAKIYHPDVNTNQDTNGKFKLINKAYQVLGNPKSRVDYDQSSAECPICYTHEVINTIELQYRCRHCGCKFDATWTVEIIEAVEIASISEKRRESIRTFQATQCSWCSKFYTNEPFLCPSRKLQSHCFSFSNLGIEERKSMLREEKWWWRMADMLREVQEKGVVAKCRLCFALNPNPRKQTCWQCGGDGLTCPKCSAKSFLRYNMDTDEWKCPNSACNGTFAFIKTKADTQYVQSERICPNCNNNLYWDIKLKIYQCQNTGCKRQYTYSDSQGVRKRKEVLAFAIALGIVVIAVIVWAVIAAIK